jgi:rod shape-determining protein MreD
MIEYVKYFALLLGLIIIQKTLIWLIAVTNYQITPDIVLIGLVFLGIRSGRIAGTVGGFVCGLIMDLLSFTFLGLMGLSKAAAGFASGFFNNENKIETYTRGYAFVMIVFFCSLINNLIYFGIYFQGSPLTFSDLLLRYVIPTAIYTGLISFLPVMFVKRRPIIS